MSRLCTSGGLIVTIVKSAAGVVQRLVYLPSKEKMTVRFRSPAPIRWYTLLTMTASSPLIGYLTKEQRSVAISSIIDFFSSERDEQIGVIAAEEVLDMLLVAVGDHIYNRGVADAQKLVATKLQELEFELETTLKK